MKNESFSGEWTKEMQKSVIHSDHAEDSWLLSELPKSTEFWGFSAIKIRFEV